MSSVAANTAPHFLLLLFHVRSFSPYCRLSKSQLQCTIIFISFFYFLHYAVYHFSVHTINSFVFRMRKKKFWPLFTFYFTFCCRWLCRYDLPFVSIIKYTSKLHSNNNKIATTTIRIFCLNFSSNALEFFYRVFKNKGKKKFNNKKQ